ATLKELISQTMVRWSQEDQIQDPELVRVMYTLLRRQYDSIGELLQALRKAYTISAASVKDTINLLAALGQIRSLLSVRMGKEEELLMINGLGYGINIILFLTMSNVTLNVSRDVLWATCSSVLPPSLQKNILLRSSLNLPFFSLKPLTLVLSQQALLKCLSRVPHLLIAYLGTLDTVQSPNVQTVVTYLAGCGLQSCPVLLAKGYPDIGWNPIEGERYLSFLRFAVFVNSKSNFLACKFHQKVSLK
ncbi:RYR3 protein, partial [Nycticryphes semicollaris]|nr:RYR3 protein [Nycticryphes semicollaris]